jgi:Leucine-rich repeat (LRR) protein
LTFYNNSLSSSIPGSISNLTSLKLLDLESNVLTGTFFTESILSLTQLVALRASFNELNGTVPVGIGALVNLQQLWIAENQFNGPLPTEFGSLQALGKSPDFFQIHLRLPFLNRNTGLSIRTSSYPCPRLFIPIDSLFLYSNSFDGNIISEFGSLPNLTQLRLYSNVFDGNLPEEIYDATKLVVLRVDQNFLDGGLSANIGKLTDLEDLRMDTQFPPGFSGSVPSELGECTRLRK